MTEGSDPTPILYTWCKSINGKAHWLMCTETERYRDAIPAQPHPKSYLHPLDMEQEFVGLPATTVQQQLPTAHSHTALARPHFAADESCRKHISGFLISTPFPDRSCIIFLCKQAL